MFQRLFVLLAASLALALLAYAGARSAVLWPHAVVAHVTASHGGKCSASRLVMSAANDYSGIPRHAIHVELSEPLSVLAPGIGASAHPQTTNLVFVKSSSPLDENTLMFVGKPKPPRLRVRAAVVYDGWGVKGDPFNLRRGECG